MVDFRLLNNFIWNLFNQLKISIYKKEKNNFNKLPMINNHDYLYWSIIFGLLIPKINHKNIFLKEIMKFDLILQKKYNVDDAIKQLTSYNENPKIEHEVFENQFFINLIKDLRNKVVNYLISLDKKDTFISKYELLTHLYLIKKDASELKLNPEVLLENYLNEIKTIVPGGEMELKIISHLFKLEIYINNELYITPFYPTEKIYLWNPWKQEKNIDTNILDTNRDLSDIPLNSFQSMKIYNKNNENILKKTIDFLVKRLEEKKLKKTISLKSLISIKINCTL